MYVKVWNASRCISSFWNDCPAGMSLITDQGLWICYLSALTSVPCALLSSGRATELLSPVCGVLTIFPFDEQSGEEGIEWKCVRPASFPGPGRSHILLRPFPHASSLLWSSLSPREPRHVILQLNADAGPCSAVELEDKIKHTKVDE